MKEINYKQESEVFKMKCPYGMREAESGFVWPVGSRFCTEKCGWFAGHRVEGESLDCNHPETR